MIGGVVLGLALVGGFNDPLFIYRPAKITNAKLIMDAAHQSRQDPYELLAISITESALKTNALSNKGAVGLFQVMCKYWHRQSGYKSNRECEKELYKARPNIKAGIMVLSTVRKKYPQCKGQLAYKCYFAGHRWQSRRGKTKQSILRYDAKIKERIEILKNHYSDFIDTYMNHLKERS